MMKISPCPFCGSEDIQLIRSQEGGPCIFYIYCVHCRECGAHGPERMNGRGLDADGAIKEWNERK